MQLSYITNVSTRNKHKSEVIEIGRSTSAIYLYYSVGFNQIRGIYQKGVGQDRNLCIAQRRVPKYLDQNLFLRFFKYFEIKYKSDFSISVPSSKYKECFVSLQIFPCKFWPS